MFGSIYSNSLNLLGRAFVVSTFLPALIFSILLLMLYEFSSGMLILESLVSSAESDPNSRIIVQSALFLLGVALFAYILFGLRNVIQSLFFSGKIIPTRKLRNARISAHTNAARKTLADDDRGALEVLQSNVWIQSGMERLTPDIIQVGPDFSCEDEKRVVGTLLKTFASLDAKNEDTENFERLTVSLWKLSVRVTENEFQAMKEAMGTLMEDANFQALNRSSIETAHARYQVVNFKLVHYPSIDFIKPTMVGNIFSYGDEYCRCRYGIPLGMIYPRLQAVVPEAYKSLIDDEKVYMDFTFNLFILLMASAIVTFFVQLQSMSLMEPVSWMFPLALSLILFLTSYLAYQLVVASMGSYMALLISSVDLYRLKLLQAFSIKMPNNMQAERETWKKIAMAIQNRTVPDLELDPSKNRGLLE